MSQTACQRRPVGHRRPAAAPRAAQAQGWPTARAGPRLLDRHHLRAEVRHPLGDAAPGDGLWLGDDLLAPPARLAGRRGLGRACTGTLLDRLGEAGQIDWSRASLDSASIPAKRGAIASVRTRRIAANRARSAMLWASAAGIPLASLLTGANRHDSVVFEELLDAVPPITPAERPSPQAAGQAACRQGLRHSPLPPGAVPAPHPGPHRPQRHRLQRAPGSAPLGRRAHPGLAQPVPAADRSATSGAPTSIRPSSPSAAALICFNALP